MLEHPGCKENDQADLARSQKLSKPGLALLLVFAQVTTKQQWEYDVEAHNGKPPLALTAYYVAISQLWLYLEKRKGIYRVYRKGNYRNNQLPV